MATFENVVCPICGCLCDDIVATVDDNKIKRVKNSCSISATKFLNYYKHRLTSPLIRKNGEQIPVRLEEAVENVAEILTNAEYPAIYGMALSSCEAQGLGVELAEELGGVIDNQTVTCHGPTALGMHDIGMPTCTLGEVRHRADLIIYWGSNVEESHPRHLRRYSVLSKGRFRKEREERKMVVIDVRKTASAKHADLFIQIEQGQDFELMSALRMILQFNEIEEESVAGIPVEKIEELAELLRNCEFGILFFGLGLTMSRGKERNIDAAISLVRDLNKWAKFSIIPMRGHYNVTGMNEVTTWQTGYPYAVDLSRGYPWYNPGETSFVDILSRGECDAALIIASDPLAHFPKDVAQNLCKIPFAVIDPHPSVTSLVADVVIPSAFTGIEAEGSAYRMDAIPLRLKKVLEPPSGIYSDEEIIQMILEKVRSMRGR
ncbi:MAG: formylmethanofuran dehydrogenase subunit B [Candidatus Methylarchaceae archaeon HK02M1]|nr:formylmethanofuran dehydrogenase subunit B [Candidatus Methylarchaceae archaeon HK02M1]